MINWLAPLLLCLGMWEQYPAKTHVLFSRVEGGKVKVLYHHGNYKRTSRRSYWPASTIKILPALAVVRWAKRHKIPLQSTLDIKDKTGRYKGTLHRLLWLALYPSSNTAYNRLVYVAGVKRVNRLARKIGLVNTCISTSYTKRDSLHSAPGFRLKVKGRWRSYPARKYRRWCWSNRTSLIDLQRLLVAAIKHRSIRRYTSKATSPMSKSIKLFFGSPLTIHHKTGYVGRYHALDNAAFKARNGRLYLLTVATPARHGKRAYRRSMKLLDRVAFQALVSSIFKQKR